MVLNVVTPPSTRSSKKEEPPREKTNRLPEVSVLKSADGRSIEARIHEVGTDFVSIQRVNDGSDFKMALSTLGTETRIWLTANATAINARYRSAQLQAAMSKIAVTNTIVKRVGGKYRYFFDIRNHSAIPFSGSVRIILLNKRDGITNASDTFDATKAIDPGLGTFVYLDAHTGPESVHADASVIRYHYEIIDGQTVGASGTGNITTKLEILE